MTIKPKFMAFSAMLFLVFSVTACTPEVGSEKWCQMMKDTPKGDWTANQVADFTRHCIFPTDDK